MPSLRIIGGRGGVETVETQGKRVTLVLDGDEQFQPALVNRVEFDNEGEISTLSYDTCKKTEHRRETNPKADVVIEGVVGESQLPTMKSLHDHTDITLVSDLFTGPTTVRRVIIEQTTDLVEIIPEGSGAELAFSFQLTVRHSQFHDAALNASREGTVFDDADDVLNF